MNPVPNIGLLVGVVFVAGLLVGFAVGLVI